MSVDSKMTAIANQIRTLIGATGTMGLDAMATNLTTANNAVASAKTAIASKNVSVPSGADVTDLAALIESISAGSSLLMSGTATVSTSGINSANLGSAFPSTGNFLLCMWLSTGPATSSGYVDGTLIVVSNGTQKIGLSNIASNYWKNAYSTCGTYITLDTGVVTAGEYYSSLRYRGRFYGTYNWACFDLAEVNFTI